MIPREKILPTVLMVINLGAAVPYFADGNWRRGVYWLAAARLTFVVTWQDLRFGVRSSRFKRPDPV